VKSLNQDHQSISLNTTHRKSYNLPNDAQHCVKSMSYQNWLINFNSSPV